MPNTNRLNDSNSVANLLLVDDKPTNLIALEAVLKGPEYNLINAHSGPEALNICSQRDDIALILMDVQMPGMDGYEVAKAIKLIRNYAEIPIVFITAIYTENSFVKKGYEAGGIDYFGKPFDPDILRLKVALYSSFRIKADLLREREKQVRISEELIKTGRKLSGVHQGMPIGVVVTDANGDVAQVNDEALRRLTSQNQVASLDDFLKWWAREKHLIQSLSLRGAARTQTFNIEGLDGSARTLLCTASPLCELDEQRLGVVVVIQDTTEQQRVGQSFQKRLSDFVSMSHPEAGSTPLS